MGAPTRSGRRVAGDSLRLAPAARRRRRRDDPTAAPRAPRRRCHSAGGCSADIPADRRRSFPPRRCRPRPSRRAAAARRHPATPVRGQFAARQHVVAEADLLHARGLRSRAGRCLRNGRTAGLRRPAASARRPPARIAAARASGTARAGHRGDRSMPHRPRPGRSTMPAPPPNGVSSTLRCRSWRNRGCCATSSDQMPSPAPARPATGPAGREHLRKQGQDGGAPAHAAASSAHVRRRCTRIRRHHDKAAGGEIDIGTQARVNGMISGAAPWRSRGWRRRRSRAPP